MRIIIATLLSIVVSGCIGVQSAYTPYHSLEKIKAATSIFVTPGNENLKTSLEFKNFKKKLEPYLVNAGFKLENNRSKADLVAYFNYGIDSGVTTIQSGSSPVYGQTGGGTTFHSGTVNTFGTGKIAYGNYSGTSYSMPTYGIIGSKSYSYSETTYTRIVAIDILDRKKQDLGMIDKIYEVKMESKGDCGQMSIVIDYMLKALFKDFPGESGKPNAITISTLGKSC